MPRTYESSSIRKNRFDALRAALGVTVILFSVSACSGSGDGEEEPFLSASQVCGSTLDSAAAEALQRVGGTTKFSELPGTDDAGHPNKFSLEHAAGTLHDDATERNQCDVFKAGDKTGYSLIEVDFSAVASHPTAHGSQDDGGTENTIYPIGVYAKTHGNVSATLFFECSKRETGEKKNSSPYVRAYLYGTPDQVSPDSTGRDLMIILNSISRAMAKQLGCASGAALPARVPRA
ncbi:hypothetical protein AB0F36_13085 [Streptomyces sp. NPDC029080]|uniref:hypothetical protein n=1 Tax=Streptomyces sp. NPDC029080 TaxID=3155017 RepID=UPI00144B558E|nr:hypothetical protein [Streptomyces sp. SID2955]